MSANPLYSNDAMSWRRSVDQLEGASFFMSRKMGSDPEWTRSWLAECWWLRNEDVFAMPLNDF